MCWRILLVFLPLASAAACNHSTFNGTHFDLQDCTELDLSCPADEISGRSKACTNLLRPGEISALSLALADAPALDALSLRGSPLGATGIAALAPSIAACAALRSLDLGSTRIGDTGARTLMQAVVQPRAPASLRRLVLQHNLISDDGVRAVATALKGTDGGLTELDLSWNAIGSRGGRYLGDALKEAGSLTTLSLSWNGLMDRGARAIGEGLAANSALATLDLQHNAIKDEGATAIAKGLRTNGAMKTLLLDHNGVSKLRLADVATALTQPAEVVERAPADAPRHVARSDDEDEEIEEISFDDDAAAEAEAADEAEAEARERATAAGACVDHGPWPCDEANCPSPSLSCADLAQLGVCAHKFGEVWEQGAPPGTEDLIVRDECPRACGRCP